LKNKIALISKELYLVSKENTSMKNNFDAHVCHVASSSIYKHNGCSTSSSISESDICALKKSVDCLGSTLSQCTMNHTRLESMFRKKHAPHMHAHKPRHTHTHHAHTHDSMYALVYTCTHCGHKGHLAKFYYDRIHISNFANKFIQVRKGANPHGPNKVWIPKFTPIVLDVGVGSHLM